MEQERASDAEIKNRTESKEIVARHRDNVLDRKPSFAHAVQQISLAEEGGSCLVIGQIDISISAPFVFTTGCFRKRHI